ncbi:penicillin-binding protein 1C [Fulvivirga sp. M361]|uniref:penicillin-binding protein 1C n=1 Tax=Fulvivirga sp. M361 TaxID=2594266 RepID=UPI001179DA3B|nr:penicillin-binding protein 1C [Fulvivirga sp. M361]TRX61839.1 penicillin-binding protein 1C [Fulvivirga sp. M361]
MVNWKKSIKWFGIVVLTLLMISRFILPEPSFTTPTSTVLEASNGDLLGARIAEDGQWRFPATDSVPHRFKVCILQFEDQYFEYHPGINPVAVLRSLLVNLREGKIVQGGSTITMQVARLLRAGKPRNYWQKLLETFIALHLETNLSKDEILNLYAGNAPFGGNVVGLEAASWRYFGRSPYELSWAEYAVLAVLPNAPSLIYPGKNKELLKQKRDFLLDRLLSKDILDDETNRLAKLEPLPERPYPLPQVAPHALDRIYSRHRGQRIQSNLKPNLQRQTQRILNDHVSQLSYNEVYNGAALILKVEDGSIISYVGNATTGKNHDNAVDVVIAPRSTGSILKPFLYAAALTHGELLPNMLVPDVPTYLSGYAPKNYFPSFDGAVKADEALYRSLNIPFVRMLQQYGVDRFYNDLKNMSMSTLVYPSNHYGLSLILGGAEARLIDLANMYGGMARVLKNQGVEYSSNDFFKTDLITPTLSSYPRNTKYLSAGAIYHTFKAMTQVSRPVSEDGWQSFRSSRQVAWKTGTSFGNKDAWAVGVTAEYVVAVWVGNADGEGRTGLTGVTAAAPLMFDLFTLLKTSDWFFPPYDDMVQATVCVKSGYPSSTRCNSTDTTWVPKAVSKMLGCPFHKVVHLSQDEQWQVNTNCEPPSNIKNASWFVLPPVQEWYFKRTSPFYRTLPPLRKDCADANRTAAMELIYPKNSDKLFIPIELDGTRGGVVFELAHRNPGLQIFWHLDGSFLGMTRDFHQMEISEKKGMHELIIVDEEGNELIKKFEILND